MRRDAPYAALFARLHDVPGIRTFSRRYRTAADTGTGEQPALFLTVGDQTPETVRGLPPVWRLEARIYLYLRNESPEGTPAVDLNDLIDAVLAVLKHQPGEPVAEGAPFGAQHDAVATTLGGAVSHCWVAGPIVTDEGQEGDQAVALIPVEMLTILDAEEE